MSQKSDIWMSKGFLRIKILIRKITKEQYTTLIM